MTEKLNILDQLNRHYNVYLDEIELLREGGSKAYRVSSGNERYFLKAVSPVFRDTVKASLEVLCYLDRSGVAVPPVLAARDGLAYMETNDSGEDRLYALFGYVEGREPEEDEAVEEIGAAVGKLHRTMDGYPGELREQEKAFFIGRYLDILERKQYPEPKLARFRDYGDELWERVSRLPRGYCHGDLHRGNVLLQAEGEPVLLDFDSSCRAYPMFDIATFCDATDYFRFDPEGYGKAAAVLERFLAGYTKHRSLAADEIRSFTDWIAIRHYQLQATILELYGIDAVDETFLDGQLDWLMRWREQDQSLSGRGIS
ncbi:phosphotransferase enzyme family protein [Gorillibacterium sp. sgz500922]|uniref:phosphotransferase enzyme family protein n=1 Tax=Gorillibacterium sp. sgz500922 TaxID=3446694 RepID=UPI003F66C31A